MSKDIHMSFKNNEEFGYNQELDLSIITHWLCFFISYEKWVPSIRVYLRLSYLVCEYKDHFSSVMSVIYYPLH